MRVTNNMMLRNTTSNINNNKYRDVKYSSLIVFVQFTILCILYFK